MAIKVTVHNERGEMKMGESLVGGMLTGVQTAITSNISDALPIAGVVFGSLAGIAVAVKLFKKLTGARA